MLLVTGYLDAVLLLLLGDGLLAGAAMAIFILTTYSTMGNSAAFIEIAVSAIIDARPHALWGVPLMTMHFIGSAFVVAAATMDWITLELRGQRILTWHKTPRVGGSV